MKWTRDRQAGMSWRQEHVQKMLNLSCYLRGKRWHQFWASRPKVAQNSTLYYQLSGRC